MQGRKGERKRERKKKKNEWKEREKKKGKEGVVAPVETVKHQRERMELHDYR